MNRVRDGNSYRDGLRAQRRNVWIDGERVGDVSTDKRLSTAVDTIASIFDYHTLPELQDKLCYTDPSGSRLPLSILQPRSASQLRDRREATEVIAHKTFGLVGRPPSFMNTVIAAFAASADLFLTDDFAYPDNVRRYYEDLCSTQLYIAHATIDPQDVRGAGDTFESRFGRLKVVSRRPEGLVVSGAKLVATGGAIADDIAVFPLPGLAEGDDRRTCAFAIPVSTDGLHFVHRPPSGARSTSLPHFPLASRFQEADCLCFFEDVFIPKERVFFMGSPDQANSLYDATGARHLSAHHDLARAMIKLRFLAGLAILLARSGKVDSFPHVEEMLGELIGFEAVASGALASSESTSETLQSGLTVPNIRILRGLRYQMPRMFARAVQVIQAVGGASLLIVPPTPASAGDIEYLMTSTFSSSVVSSARRLAELTLARDATTGEYGQRQLLFEKYHAGDPVRLAALSYRFDADAAVDLAAACLRIFGEGPIE
ncbi:MAG: 4-hydroxyphenylacetate 3-hydroxylase N-terminal domain-containing protein [Acidimicrobiales bacterium]